MARVGRYYPDEGDGLQADLFASEAAFTTLGLPGGAAMFAWCNSLVFQTRSRDEKDRHLAQEFMAAAHSYLAQVDAAVDGDYPRLEEYAAYRQEMLEIKETAPALFTGSFYAVYLGGWARALLREVAGRHPRSRTLGDRLQNDPLWSVATCFHPEWFGGVPRPDPSDRKAFNRYV